MTAANDSAVHTEDLTKIYTELRSVGEPFVWPFAQTLAALDRANRRYLEAYRANSVFWALAEQVATMDEEIHRIRLRGRIEHVERVAKTIRRWQDHGLADRDIDPRTTAGALVSMLSNFAYWWLEHYAELRRYLETECLLLADRPDTCRIYRLGARAQAAA